MQYEVLKPLTTPQGLHLPGALIEADQFHNTEALISQRFIRPVGDGARIAALEARVIGLVLQLRELQDALGGSPKAGKRKDG